MVVRGVGSSMPTTTLPSFNTEDLSLQLLQSSWAKSINPLLNSPLAKPVLLQSVVLTTGKNTINHKLGINLTGWQVIRQRGLCSIYDLQDANLLPSKTLVLMASSGVTVDLLVF